MQKRREFYPPKAQIYPGERGRYPAQKNDAHVAVIDKKVRDAVDRQAHARPESREPEYIAQYPVFLCHGYPGPSLSPPHFFRKDSQYIFLFKRISAAERVSINSRSVGSSMAASSP